MARHTDVAGADVGTFVRPAEEAGTDRPRVEQVLGYLARTAAGLVLDPPPGGVRSHRGGLGALTRRPRLIATDGRRHALAAA